MRKFNYKKVKLLLFALIAPFSFLLAQNQVKGHVTDTSGAALSGVSVTIKGTSKGTTTKTDGSFSVQTSPDATLVFSYIGFASKEIKANTENISVRMEPAIQTGEAVVVTALGIRKEKNKVSYATQEVKGAALQKAPEANVASNLVGKVAGLGVATTSTMFESPTVTLRGASTLVVLDGVPTDPNSFSFWSIDPNNIESITVLKGTSAAALYGAIGKNGAIMITSKNGKDGANGTEISFNSSSQFQGGFLNLPKTQKEYGMGFNGYYAFINGNGGGGWYDADGYVWGPKLNQKDQSTASGYAEVPQYNSPYNPDSLYEFTQAGYTDKSHYKPLPYITRGANNLQNFLDKEFINTTNVSVAGKNDKGDFRVSLTNVYQKGQVPNTKFNSTTLSVAGNLKVSDKLKVQALLSYNRQNSPNYPATATGDATTNGAGPGDYFYNILLWMGPDVDIRDLRNYWQPAGPNPRNGRPAYGTLNMQQYNYNYAWYNNPYFLAYENLNLYNNNVVNAQLNANYSFTKDLNLLVRSAIATNNSSSETKQPWSLIDNSFNYLPQGNYSLSQSNNFQIINDLLLTYRKTFLKDFHATVSAGGSNRYNYAAVTNESTVGGLTIPNYYNLAASVQPPGSSNSKAERESKSVMGYIDADYKNMIYVGITGRNDWVTNLPKPNNSYFFPSANAGLVVSKMIKLPEFISYMKLRGNWAQVSDNTINLVNSIYQDWYTASAIYTSGTRWNNNAALDLPGSIPSHNLKSNTTISQEYGAELNFLKNRIAIDFSLFSYKQENFVVSTPISSTSGYNTLYVNGGETNRRGMDVVVRGTPVRTRDFNWDVTINWDQVHTYRKNYYGGDSILKGIKVNGRTDAFFGSAFQTTPDGKVIYDGNGNPLKTPYDIFLGFTDPKWSFGFINNFRYKNFGLSVSVDGRIGGVLFNGVESQMYDGGNHPATANSYRDDAYLGNKTYLPEGAIVTGGGSPVYNPLDGSVVSDDRKFATNETKVNYINWVRNYYRSVKSIEIYSRTFVKLREVVLSYSLNRKVVSKTPFKDASISLTGRNLVLWTKVPFMDPDGYNNYSIPEPSYRNIGINLNLKF